MADLDTERQGAEGPEGCMSKVQEDIWEWRPSGPACKGKHVWVRYISHRFRECCSCGEREGLWADFGYGPKPNARTD